MFLRIVNISILALILTSTSQASTTESGFASWVHALYQGSTSKIISEQESLKAEALKTSAQRFSTTEINVTPYLQQYTLKDVPSAYEGQQKGLRLGLSQNTPYGLKLSAGLDRKSENDLTLGSNEKVGTSFGLSVPLWQNVMGYADRQLQTSLLADASLGQLDAEIKLRQSCESVLLTLTTYWSLQQKDKFFTELLKDSKDLNKVLERSRQKGELSKIEYLGTQSELLAIENQKIQNERDISAAQFQIKKEAVASLDLSLQILDPQGYFDFFWKEYKKIGPSETLSSMKVIKSQESSAAFLNSIQNRNRTAVSLNLQKNQREGDALGDDYKDDDFKAELNLTLKLNDNIEKAELSQALARSKQSLALIEQNKREQALTYEVQAKDLENQFKASENLKKRLEYLVVIKDEYFKRFKQGRIDYQEYLRQKETWAQSSLQLIDYRINTWNNLVKSYHDLSRLDNICEKRKSL